MTDRPIVYDGALPQTTDILSLGKFGLVGQAFQNQALLGSSTVIAGLACAPTSPASLQVTIGTGSIYQLDPTDSSPYGDLGIDNNVIMKQGILHTAANLTITPPGTVGFSQVYLVEASLTDVDSGLVTLSYFNSAPPVPPATTSVPFAGPAGSGISQFTTRTCVCNIALKAGVPATTGTQVAPAVDAGFVALYAITVVNGATSITSGNIALLPSAPFFPTLPQVPYQVQGGTYIYGGQDTGAANAYIVTFVAGQPIPLTLTAGLTVKFKALNANTGASTVNVNGLGAVAIRRATGVALSANDINSGQVVELTYDGTIFQMANYLGAGATSNTSTVVGIPYVTDTGAQNAIVATFSPAITSGQQVAGLFVSVKLANTITGACTINVSGLGAKNLLTGDLANPPNNVYMAGQSLLLVYDGTQYSIVNTSSLTYRKPASNTTIYVNQVIGNDSNDGTSNVSGHALASIGAAVRLAFTYAPSQFSITVQIAAGTYIEAVSTPSNAGPSLIINGASTASVIVSSGSANCISVSGPNTLLVQNLTVQNAGVYPWAGFSASIGSYLVTNNTQSNACGIVWEADTSTIIIGNHTINGSGAMMVNSQHAANVSFSGDTITFAQPISYSSATVVAQFGGAIGVQPPVTFANPNFVSGTRYTATFNGTISQAGLGVNFFPGTVAGITSFGGQVSL